MMLATLTELVEDHGSICRFAGQLEDGQEVLVFVDHRPAQYCADWIEEHGEILVDVEPWQLTYVHHSGPMRGEAADFGKG